MSHYDVLGLEPTASGAEIRARYLELAKVVHPDAGGDQFQFQVLAEAYKVLGDPAARASYDAERNDRERLTDERRGPATGRPRSGPRPGAGPGAGDGGVGAWLSEGCATELAGWLFAVPFLVILWLASRALDERYERVETIGVGALFALVAIVLALRALRGRSDP